MDKEKKLQDEAINISHRQLSSFTPRKGYEPDSNIIQCMVDFAKSDIVKEYHNNDKKFTLDNIKKAIIYGHDKSTEGEYLSRVLKNSDEFIQSLKKQ